MKSVKHLGGSGRVECEGMWNVVGLLLRDFRSSRLVFLSG